MRLLLVVLANGLKISLSHVLVPMAQTEEKERHHHGEKTFDVDHQHGFYAG
jgi:uncharacterized protein YifN (PemK superfamily)